MKINKIAIMGSGGIGAYYGGLLAKNGYDVTFIARGLNLEALSKKGLSIISHFGSFNIPTVKTTNNSKEVGVVDFIFFSVKTYDAIQAAKDMVPMIGKDTIILPIQNINMAPFIAEVVGEEHVLGGVTYVYSAMKNPGEVVQTSNFHRIVFGEFSNKKTNRTKAVAELFNSVGVTVVETDDIQKELWSKLIFIGPSCGVGSVVGLGAGDYRNVPETREMLISAMREVESIAKKKGVNLDYDEVKQKMDFVDGLEPGATTSMQRDIQNGKKSELEELIGLVIKMGIEEQVPTPTHDFIYASLKPKEKLARKK